MPIVALFIAVLFSAFTQGKKEMNHEDPLWFYTETTADHHDDDSKYVPLNGQNTGCVGAGSVRCVIEAPEGDPGQPDLDDITNIVSFKP